ncbi:Pectate lyase [Porphyromonadaceae bacterium KH3CP3RA]|nr:Pectate lyase [Porphyromonadaceae bacterium KH3CP3RA]
MLLLIPAGVAAQIPAFPGAEGAGKYTTGGRGGKVLYVTSLEDSEQPGTLRWAVKQKGPRTILFKISGHIRLKSPLKINNGDLTIAGQSAPGDGICISDYETVISADNVIIRFLRFRLGDETKRAVDALSGYRNKNIIIDHCSMSWAIDELSSFYDNTNFTMQWCFITESLRKSVHGKGKHGYGGIWGGQNASFHHNLLAHNDSRNPRFCGSRYSNQPGEERVDFRNNVIYNWGSNNIYAAEGGSYNIINNYYKYGPASSSGSKKRLINPDADNGENKQPKGTYGHFYITGNYLDENPEVTRDNRLGIEMGSSFTKFAPGVTLEDIIADEEFSFLPVTTDNAEEAYEKVLKYGGYALVRDIHDLRYVDNVKNRSYSFEGSGGSSNGLIDSQNDVGGWPEYKTYNNYVDSDSDGIPDGWLEENYPGKKAEELDSNGYTYLEVYLNSLVDHLMGRDFFEKKVKKLVVDKSGKDDFTTIQAAIDAVRAFDPDYATTIFVKEGTYFEKLIYYRGKYTQGCGVRVYSQQLPHHSRRPCDFCLPGPPLETIRHDALYTL